MCVVFRHSAVFHLLLPLGASRPLLFLYGSCDPCLPHIIFLYFPICCGYFAIVVGSLAIMYYSMFIRSIVMCVLFGVYARASVCVNENVQVYMRHIQPSKFNVYCLVGASSRYGYGLTMVCCGMCTCMRGSYVLRLVCLCVNTCMSSVREPLRCRLCIQFYSSIDIGFFCIATADENANANASVSALCFRTSTHTHTHGQHAKNMGRNRDADIGREQKSDTHNLTICMRRVQIKKN